MLDVTTTAPGRDTRERILDAAWALAVDQGLEKVRVADIAAAAGVSRQLVYAHFDNRAGLLTAMARHRDRSSGFAERVRSTEDLPPAQALEAVLRAWCDHLPAILPVARGLEAAAATGDEGATAWHDRMRALRDTFSQTISRVRRAGGLSPRWTVGTATDWIWAHAHVSTYHHLVNECGWSPADYTRHTVRTLLAELLH
jgi:AcrR family transcriptional regulator